MPFLTHIRRVLDERGSHAAPKSRFLDELEDYMTPDAAEETLSAVTAWARYAGRLPPARSALPRTI